MGNFMERLLRLMADNDCVGGLMWDTDLNFYIVCNDEFHWGSADAEEVTPDTLPELLQAFLDGGDVDGTTLYCARRRGVRPQGAMCKYLVNLELFEHLPVRVVCTGNPVEWGAP